MSSNNYTIAINNDFMSDTKNKVLEVVNEKVSWKTDIFKEKADIHIFVSNHTSSPDGEVKITFGVHILGVKSYPYEIRSYPEFVIEFLDTEGKYSSEIYANSLEKMIDDFLSYLYALEKELTNK